MRRTNQRHKAMLLTAVLITAVSAMAVNVSAKEEDLVIVEHDGQRALIDRNEFGLIGKRPSTLEEILATDTAGNSDWEKTYYGEGSGMELTLFGTSYSDTTFAANIYDYGTSSYPLQDYGDIIIAKGFNGIEMTLVDENTLDSSYFTLTREDDHTLRMDVKEAYPEYLYRDVVDYTNDTAGELVSRELWSIEFTDIQTLAENPKEDKWGGSWGYSTYEEHPEAEGYENYVCIQQIYGTDDYFVAECSNYEYSGMTEWFKRMMESKDDMLLRFMSGPNVAHAENTYALYRKNSDGELMKWDYLVQESQLSTEEYADMTFMYLTTKMIWEL